MNLWELLDELLEAYIELKDETIGVDLDENSIEARCAKILYPN